MNRPRSQGGYPPSRGASAAGAPFAPEALYVHIDALTDLARWLCGSRQDAEDLVQDTLVKVLSRPRVIRVDLRSYLLRALRNGFYTRPRTASRRPQLTSCPIDLARLPAVGDSLHRIIECRAVLAAIAELPEDQRAAVVGVDLLGLSYQEVAGQLEVAEPTVGTRLHRGRRRVARRVS
jgi:RNA polymerase sigma-70 factor (ECF subfamily)